MAVEGEWVGLALRALPGMVGAAVSLRWVPGSTALHKLGNFATGAAMAWYGPPMLSGFLPSSMTSGEGAMGTLAFAVGMFGVSVANLAVQTLAGLKLGEIIAKRLGG